MTKFKTFQLISLSIASIFLAISIHGFYFSTKTIDPFYIQYAFIFLVCFLITFIIFAYYAIKQENFRNDLARKVVQYPSSTVLKDMMKKTSEGTMSGTQMSEYSWISIEDEVRLEIIRLIEEQKRLATEREKKEEHERRKQEFKEFLKESSGGMDTTELDKQFDEWKDKKDKI